MNLASVVTFLGLFGLVWIAKAGRWPAFPRWTLAFPLLVVFLLTNKVYSPQYGLWLVPLFALLLPHLRAFVAFSVADVAVFVTLLVVRSSRRSKPSGPDRDPPAAE